MEFGICFDTHIDKWDLIRYAEELGYDRACVPQKHFEQLQPATLMDLVVTSTKA